MKPTICEQHFNFKPGKVIPYSTTEEKHAKPTGSSTQSGKEQHKWQSNKDKYDAKSTVSTPNVSSSSKSTKSSIPRISSSSSSSGQIPSVISNTVSTQSEKKKKTLNQILDRLFYWKVDNGIGF